VAIVLLIWFKFLYFLRIFKSTSSLIRMIDIKYFLLILFVTIMAFGDAFGVIARNNPPIDSVPGDGAETFVYWHHIHLQNDCR
jgi:hypothetical protein